MASNGIISQDRVKAYGEVFTPDSIVNDMMDGVDKELNTEYGDKEYISAVFLEPSCGDGQFLVRIFSRKLERVQKLPIEEREIHLVKALCSIFGVDIQKDNVINARKRLYAIATGGEVETFDLNNQTHRIHVDLGINYSDKLNAVINYILERNIICGNTLDDNNPVLLTDYKFNGDKVSMAECPLTDLNMELTKTEEVGYLDLANIKIDSAGSDDEYDF